MAKEIRTPEKRICQSLKLHTITGTIAAVPKATPVAPQKDTDAASPTAVNPAGAMIISLKVANQAAAARNHAERGTENAKRDMRRSDGTAAAAQQRQDGGTKNTKSKKFNRKRLSPVPASRNLPRSSHRSQAIQTDTPDRTPSHQYIRLRRTVLTSATCLAATQKI